MTFKVYRASNGDRQVTGLSQNTPVAAILLRNALDRIQDIEIRAIIHWSEDLRMMN